MKHQSKIFKSTCIDLSNNNYLHIVDVEKMDSKLISFIDENIFKICAGENKGDVDIWTYQYNAIEIDSIGMNNYQDLDFLHIYPTNLIIEINDIDFLPIEIDVDLFPDLESINTNNGTTERLLYSSQFEETEINFRRKNADNEYETYQIIIPASNPTELLDFNITLNNSDFN